MYALSALDGTEQWVFQTEGQVWSSPAVVDDTVYVGSFRNTVYALSETETTTETTSQNFTQQAKLAADDGDDCDQFGQSVTLSSDGSAALIGASNDNSNGESAGSAYVFN